MCETASVMPEVLAPNVRTQFAKRLKIIRTQRGFDRARYFAKSLGIEENRYTRYERAEVEPSLTLIHKMCATLHVTPNELLGFAEFNDAGAFQTAPGMAESSGETPQGPGACGRQRQCRLAGLASGQRGRRHPQRAGEPRQGARGSACQLPRDRCPVPEAAGRPVRHGRRDRRRPGGEGRPCGAQDGDCRADPRLHRGRQRQGAGPLRAVIPA